MSVTVAVLSCACSDFGLCDEWQVEQERFRALCALAFQRTCAPRSWQVRQAAEASRPDFGVNRPMLSALGLSACVLPGPWQLSHVWPDPAGVRGFSALP